MASGDVLLVSFWMRSGAPGKRPSMRDSAPCRERCRPGARLVRARGGLRRGRRERRQPRSPQALRAPERPAPREGTRADSAASRPLNAPALAGPAWKKVQFPFALTRDFNKGEAELTFTIGLREQTLEIGGIELENYRTTKKVAELPYTKLGYAVTSPTPPGARPPKPASRRTARATSPSW